MQETATTSRAATDKGARQRGATHTASATALRVIAVVALLLLTAQFILGMLLNLFVGITSAVPSSGGLLQALAWSLGQSNMPLLIAHVVVGLGLVLVSLLSLILSITGRQRKWIVFSSIAALGLVVATVSGAGFVSTGAAASSMAMSIGFLLALLSYATGFYMTR